MIPRELLRHIRRIEFATRRKVTTRFSGGYLSTFRGQGMEFAEVREYQPGDGIRTIDWNVTARMSHPFVKRFVEERELELLFVVDLSGSLGFGSAARSKQEVAVELCALIAALAIGNNDRVGVVLATDRVEAFIPAGKGKRHLYRVIRALLSHTPAGRGTDLPAAIEFATRLARRHSTLFIVSDFVMPVPDPRLERALSRAALRHDPIAVSIRDPRDAELPPVGLLEVADPESGAVCIVDTLDGALRQRVAAAAERRTGAIGRLFKRHGVDHIALSTVEQSLPPLLRFFRERARRLR